MTKTKSQKQRAKAAAPNNSLQKTAGKRKAKKRAPRQGGGQVAVAAAYSLPSFIKIGLPDLRSHRVSWITGYIWVGNGTIGATDSVYFVRSDQSQTVLPCVPVLSSDAVLGQTYCADVEKHYARKVIKRQWLHLISVQPATSNNMMVAIVPVKGAGDTVHVTVQATTAAANTLANTIGMSGVMTANSYESKSMDMTKYIGGGAGADQNDFAIQGNAAQTSVVGQAVDGGGYVPSVFYVAGNSTTTGLRGTATHMVVIEQECDFVDFIGGNTSADNWALADEETGTPTKGDTKQFLEVIGTKTVQVRRV